jgi:hypothetical protein
MKLDKVTEINANVTSKNGYPIYDFMTPSYPSDGHGDRLSGYVSATGKAFYTENDEVLKQFRDCKDIEEQKAFIQKNPKFVVNFRDIPQMDHHAQMAYHHLKSHEARKNTMEKKYYGCAYLVEENKVLIFHQTRLPEIYGNNVNLNDKHEFKNASLKLLDLYESGKAKPEAEITDGAFEKLKATLKNYVVVPKLEKEHELKKEIETFIGFMNNFQVKFDINYDNTKEVKITMESGDNKKEYSITKSSKPGYVKVSDEQVSMNNLLKDIYIDSQILDSKIDLFLGKKPKV